MSRLHPPCLSSQPHVSISPGRPPSKPRWKGASQDDLRDPDLWFLDGNIDIAAQSTYFRLHEGVLSRHSTVFPKLFAEAELELDGVSAFESDGYGDIGDNLVVHVSDSAHDFKHLLHILYDGFECAYSHLYSFCRLTMSPDT